MFNFIIIFGEIMTKDVSDLFSLEVIITKCHNNLYRKKETCVAYTAFFKLKSVIRLH